MDADNLLDLQQVLKSYSDEDRDFMENIFNGIKLNSKKIAVHAWCTDGAVAGAIVRFMEELPLDAIIPLDYFVLGENAVNTFIKKESWYMIIDLEPFNKNVIEYYNAHHRSTIGKLIPAKKIF